VNFEVLYTHLSNQVKCYQLPGTCIPYILEQG
jgi:hypothetical protein